MKIMNISKAAISALALAATAASVVACAPQMRFAPGYLPAKQQPGSNPAQNKPGLTADSLAGYFVSNETVFQVQDDGTIQVIYESDLDRVSGLKMVGVVHEKSGSETRDYLITDADCTHASVCNKIPGAEVMRLKNQLEVDSWNNLNVIEMKMDSLKNLHTVKGKIIRITEAEVRKEVERVKTAEAAREHINSKDQVE